MNEQAQKVLIDLLNRAVSGIDKAVEFSQAQIPDVIHQLLVWKFTISIICFVIGLLIIPLWLLIYKKSMRFVNELQEKKILYIKSEKEKAKVAWDAGEDWTRYHGRSGVTSLSSTEFDKIMGASERVKEIGFLGNPAIFCASGCFSLFMSMAMIDFEWLKIWLAPKLYLIEYAATLIK